ncbi:hypothetical protein Nepgr_013484 [Nepenthes gracilis]|uniref:Uncharacterized protein n=1 Tax=Nepenthes gracilis TaxID=150966 RepID=A0AAD3SHZ8_NEPGR|nr:hypothetical protein Nepgr_013484 [Nepenthes gracilis]
MQIGEDIPANRKDPEGKEPTWAGEGSCGFPRCSNTQIETNFSRIVCPGFSDPIVPTSLVTKAPSRQQDKSTDHDELPFVCKPSSSVVDAQSQEALECSTDCNSVTNIKLGVVNRKDAPLPPPFPIKGPPLPFQAQVGTLLASTKRTNSHR